jgi:hypothetical protein
MSLYNHVANKEGIPNGIVDLVWSEIELPAGEEGSEAAIRKYAISAHDVLLRHPWACNLTPPWPACREAGEASAGRVGFAKPPQLDCSLPGGG